MERNTLARDLGHLALHCDAETCVCVCVRACEGSLDWPSVYFSSTKDGFTTINTHTRISHRISFVCVLYV